MSDEYATIQKHALGIVKVLKGGFILHYLKVSSYLCCNITFGITDKLKSLGSLAGKSS